MQILPSRLRDGGFAFPTQMRGSNFSFSSASPLRMATYEQVKRQRKQLLQNLLTAARSLSVPQGEFVTDGASRIQVLAFMGVSRARPGRASVKPTLKRLMKNMWQPLPSLLLRRRFLNNHLRMAMWMENNDVLKTTRMETNHQAKCRPRKMLLGPAPVCSDY